MRRGGRLPERLTDTADLAGRMKLAVHRDSLSLKLPNCFPRGISAWSTTYALVTFYNLKWQPHYGSQCYLPVVQASLFQLMHMSHDDHAQPMKCAMVSLSVHVQSLQ